MTGVWYKTAPIGKGFLLRAGSRGGIYRARLRQGRSDILLVAGEESVNLLLKTRAASFPAMIP